MQNTRQFFSHNAFAVIAAFFLLFAPALSSAAEKPKKAPTAKQSAKKITGKSTRTTAAANSSPKIDEGTARASFETFTQEWMAKLVEAEEFQRTKQVKVSESSDGFTAEYTGYLPQRAIEVKQTEYNDTPFIGTLTYYQRTLRCTGKTKEQALQGPFQQVDTSQIREIFRFTKGKWMY